MFETEAERQAALQARRDTIARAITFIQETGAGAGHIIRQVGVREELQEDREGLVELLTSALAEDASTGHRFGAWKISQRICQAVGLPY